MEIAYKTNIKKVHIFKFAKERIFATICYSSIFIAAIGRWDKSVSSVPLILIRATRLGILQNGKRWTRHPLFHRLLTRLQEIIRLMSRKIRHREITSLENARVRRMGVKDNGKAGLFEWLCALCASATPSSGASLTKLRWNFSSPFLTAQSPPYITKTTPKYQPDTFAR